MKKTVKMLAILLFALSFSLVMSGCDKSTESLLSFEPLPGDEPGVPGEAGNGNTEPVAYAGRDYRVDIGNHAELNAVIIPDEDGDELSYMWSFSSKPSASKTKINNRISPNTDFHVDVDGVYVVRLMVYDGTDYAFHIITISTHLRAFDFSMTLGLDETEVTGNWKTLSNTNDGDAEAEVVGQGSDGTCSVTGDMLTYNGEFGNDETDTCELEIYNGVDRVAVTATIYKFYWKQVSGGYRHTAAIRADGTLWSWGYGCHGEMGNGTTTCTNRNPVQESTHSTWSSVSAGEYHTTAIRSDGTLWSWGYNGYGQLGDGTYGNNRNTPRQESTYAHDWSSVDAGWIHTAAIKTNGTLWSWGYGGQGQMGNGTSNSYNPNPIQEGTHSTWSSVSVGYHTAAIKTNGTLLSWGYGCHGQMGNGSPYYCTNQNPVQVGKSTWSSVSVGVHHTAAIRSNGTLWSWGYAPHGQMGNGTSNNNNPNPVQEGTHSTWSSVNAGEYYTTAAIRSNGTLWSWGYGCQGQMGNGTTTCTNRNPVQESTYANNWSSVGGGGLHATAIKSNATLWLWGANNYGELGDGTSNWRYVPGQLVPQP